MRYVDTAAPIDFFGAYTDPVTGFVYLNNRYYDPSTGQFITQDPDVAQTGQPYEYAADNPRNNTDPTGLFGCGDFGPFSGACGTVSSAVSWGEQKVQAAGTWAVQNSSTIATVAAGASAIPGVDLIAAPTAVVFGGISAAQDVQSGNYVGAAFNAVGVLSAGAGYLLKDSADGWDATESALWSRGSMQTWAGQMSALRSAQLRRLTLGSFGVSDLFGWLADPAVANGEVFGSGQCGLVSLGAGGEFKPQSAVEGAVRGPGRRVHCRVVNSAAHPVRGTAAGLARHRI